MKFDSIPVLLVQTVVLSATAIIFGILPSPAMGDEPCEQFLEALRDNGYHNEALDYLSDMAASPLASSHFKQTIPFERAQTFDSRLASDSRRICLKQRLNEADKLLTSVEAAANSPELKARAQSYRGEVQLFRAKRYLKLADNDRLTASEKKVHLADAGKFLKQALETFGRAKDSYKKILESFQLDYQDPESKRKLKRMRLTYVGIRTKLPQILEMSADTLEPGDPNRKAYLEAAAKEFEQLWVKYSTAFSGGLDSCLYAARCYSKLGMNEDALSFLQQILSLKKNSATLPRQRAALVLASDCWSKMDPYPIGRCDREFGALLCSAYSAGSTQ